MAGQNPDDKHGSALSSSADQGGLGIGSSSHPRPDQGAIDIDATSQTSLTSNEAYDCNASAKSFERRMQTFYVATVFEKVMLASAIVFVLGDLCTAVFENFKIWDLFLWRWGVMVICTICGRLVTGRLIIAIAVLVEKECFIRKKVFYFFYGTLGSFRVCTWLTLVLLAWYFVFHTVERSTKLMSNLDLVSRLLFSAWAGSVIWFFKTVMVKIVAAFYHSKTFFDRIQQSIFREYVLQELSGSSMMEMPLNVVSKKSSRWMTFIGEGASPVQGTVDMSKLHKLKRGKISPWTIRGLVKDMRKCRFLAISNVIGDTNNGELFAGVKAIATEGEAKAAAERIFNNVSKFGERHIKLEDLVQYLSRSDVDFLLTQFMGASETKKIDKSAFDDWVVKAYIDRKILARSLNDSKTAIQELDMLLSAIVQLVIIITFFFVMGFQTPYVYVSYHLLLIFVYFSNECKAALNSIKFVFLRRPFDVGDRCDIDGVEVTVEEVNLFTTVFLTVDGQKISSSNAMLAAKSIYVFSRSQDSVLFSIPSSVSESFMDALMSEIKLFIESNPDLWRSDHSVLVKSIRNGSINMVLLVTPTRNGQDMVQRNQRISRLTLKVHMILQGLSVRSRVQTPTL